METVKSNARLDMEWAGTFLSQCEDGTGLHPERVELALSTIGAWKKKFVSFLIGKPNWSWKKETQERADRCLCLDEEGTVQGPDPVHTMESANTLADNIFLKHYQDEVEARNETIDDHREAGVVELCEETSDHAWSYGEPYYPADDVAEIDMREEPVMDWQERSAKVAELYDALKTTHHRSAVLQRARVLQAVRVITYKDYQKLKRLASVLPVEKKEQDTF